MNVVILYGQVSADAGQDEQDVLVQVETVSDILSQLGYTPVAIPLSLDLGAAATALQWLQPAFVFNLVESVQGQGHYIHLGPTLLEALHVPYTGATTAAMLTTSNKLLMKKALAAARLPTPAWTPAESVLRHDIPISGPYIVKSVWEHGSIGLDDEAVMAHTAELRPYLARHAQDAAAPWFVERYVPGREFNLSLIANSHGARVLPPAEIEFVAYPEGKAQIVGYRAKWDESSFEYQHTCRRFDFAKAEAPLLNRLQKLAVRCWRLFELRGYARVDMRLDTHGQPWIVDVNANPCLAPDSGFVAAAERAGWTLSHVVQHIIADTGTPTLYPVDTATIF